MVSFSFFRHPLLIPQTSFLTGTFFCHFLQQSGSSSKIKIFRCSVLLSWMSWITHLRHFIKPFKSLVLKQSYKTFALVFWQTFKLHNHQIPYETEFRFLCTISLISLIFDVPKTVTLRKKISWKPICLWNRMLLQK